MNLSTLRTTKSRSEGGEPRDFLGAPPRKRVPGAAVTVVVDDAAVALESDVGTKGSEAGSHVEHGAGVEPRATTALENGFAQVGIAGRRLVGVDRDRASPEDEFAATRDDVEHGARIPIVGEHDPGVESAAGHDDGLPQARAELGVAGQGPRAEPRAVDDEVSLELGERADPSDGDGPREGCLEPREVVTRVAPWDGHAESGDAGDAGHRVGTRETACGGRPPWNLAGRFWDDERVDEIDARFGRGDRDAR